MTDDIEDRPSALETLAHIRSHALALIEGRAKPYDAGWEMWGEAMGGGIEDSLDGEQCEALWLLWGALTDWVENRPEETAQAENAMRRAATDWLEASHNERLWRPFFDHWLYIEMGYERPAADPGP